VTARHKLTALVLGTVDYGEADRVVSLLSRERGKLSAFARGARASRRRFGGLLEPFTLLAVEVRERRGSELPALESASAVRGHGAIRSDLARIGCAAYACELARELVRDHEPHVDLFDLLSAYLALLDAVPAEPAALRAFELGALRAAGIGPRLDGCACCGGELGSGRERLRFDPGQGGILCPRCSARAGPVGRELGRGAARALGRLQAGGLEAAPAVRLAPGEAAEARAALGVFIEHHLGRRLKARRFLDEMGPALGG